MTFEKTYQQYKQQIYRLCLGYTNDADWAKDIVQETFITVWKNLENFRGEAQVSTWIYRIAVNNCLKQIAKKKRVEYHHPVLDEVTEEIEENPNLVLLRRYISELPELDRVIISMELEEMPQAEIADVLNMASGNVRVRIHRIKEKLAKKFKKQIQ